MKQKEGKTERTNVMRLLDQKGVRYESHCYADTDALAGTEVAEALGEKPEQVFKTLVTVGASRQHYVFLVPVEKSLHLKKAAKAVGEKSIEMILARELLPLTGYVHGGCSPIGMKKPFRTVIDASAEREEKIFFSAGKIGYQIETTLAELRKALAFETAEITEEA